MRKRVVGLAPLGFRVHRHRFAGRVGLEIGGPSKVFERSDYLPIYAWAARVDGVNFANETVWEGAIAEGANYRYAKGHCGYQYVGEGSSLARIQTDSYDFVASSHSLEHAANALKSIGEWTRVLKPGGPLLVIVPERSETFDRHRPVASFDHLLEDFRNDVGEDDLTHLDEILRLHDLGRDPLAGTVEQISPKILEELRKSLLASPRVRPGTLETGVRARRSAAVLREGRRVARHRGGEKGLVGGSLSHPESGQRRSSRPAQSARGFNATELGLSQV